VTDRLPQTLRSDAVDNRARILDAARAVFAAEGLNVPMREVARRAGVGPATLYRRFPTKEMLVTEAFADAMRACHAIVDEGLADPDPWHGFCLVIEKICDLHARNRGFTAAFMSAFPNAMDFAAGREYALSSIAELARRARDAGHLRPDFALDDVILILMANRGIRATAPAAQVAASRRFAALAIQALQASPDASPLPPAARLAPAVSIPRRSPAGETDGLRWQRLSQGEVAGRLMPSPPGGGTRRG
jgi:AcrR family transcriptional regulator